jgi:hypothetical protein
MKDHKWVEDLFRTIDQMDADKFAGYLADNAEFKFGNSPAAVGKAATRDAVAGFFTTISGLSHNLQGIWIVDNIVICRGDVTYTRKDSSTITLPFADILEMNGRLISNYVIYMDVTPLFMAETKG